MVAVGGGPFALQKKRPLQIYSKMGGGGKRKRNEKSAGKSESEKSGVRYQNIVTTHYGEPANHNPSYYLGYYINPGVCLGLSSTSWTGQPKGGGCRI